MRVAFRASPKKGKLRRLLSIEPLMRGPVPDKGLLMCVGGLLVFGWVMVYSASISSGVAATSGPSAAVRVHTE